MGLLDELLKAQKPKRNLMGTQMVKGPDQPYLRQDYPTVYGALGGLLGTAPDEMAGSVMDPNTAAVRRGAEYGFPVGTALAMLPAAGLTKGLPVGMGIKPINLEKGIYRPELTMEEMLKVKDIPTVERVRKSMELVGEKEFENMVNAQFKKYKPTNQDTEAMLVESVTLNILGKAQRAPYPQQAALDLAQQRAALPVSQGGLGLPAGNNPLMNLPSGLTRQDQARLIQSHAENFAAKAKEMGLSASVEHSGSKAGPSSYVTVLDPITGAKFESPFRFSGHSKGPKESQFVYDVGDDFSNELGALEKMALSIPKAERDAIQSARQAKMIEDLASQEKERIFSQGRPAVQGAMQEANLQQTPYTKAFSNSGKYIGSTEEELRRRQSGLLYAP